MLVPNSESVTNVSRKSERGHSDLSQRHGWRREDIAYCSNVHAGKTLDELTQNLRSYITPVRSQRGLDTMTSGLWISATAAVQLQDNAALLDFQQALRDAGLSLTSINGFPYRGFHQQEVKAKVYLPDWSMPARLQYSKNLADILAVCLPENCEFGAISTLPLGYKQRWNDAKHQQAMAYFLELNQYLAELYSSTGKRILVCLEMEPDCVLESTYELIQFFGELATENTLQNSSDSLFLGVCYDVCHQAVMHEDAYQALKFITNAGIQIGKIQLSSALQVDFDSSKKIDPELFELLQEYAEPTYLHQVRAKQVQGGVIACNDLSDALKIIQDRQSELSKSLSWRIHFHVPINSKRLNHASLTTTQTDLLRVFDFLRDYFTTSQMLDKTSKPWLEVETYSWHVLPQLLHPLDDAGLICGIVDELNWVETQLAARQLLLR